MYILDGYAGWDPKQLNTELKEKSWLITAAESIFLLADYTTMWAELVKHMGGDYALLVNSPIDPSLN